MHDHQLAPKHIEPYMMSPRPGRRAGAVMTLHNEATDCWITLRFRRPMDSSGQPFSAVMVDLLGAGHLGDYGFIGSFKQGQLIISTKFKGSKDSAVKARKAIQWVLYRIHQGKDLATVRVLHEGVCGRCGKTLTRPDSIDNGLGPDCFKIVNKKS